MGMILLQKIEQEAGALSIPLVCRHLHCRAEKARNLIELYRREQELCRETELLLMEIAR